ncbi:MAG: PIN domain nuclease [Bacteroidetes bacterium]|nr:PIN domain nuclease [Bacteroidota bacterium]
MILVDTSVLIGYLKGVKGKSYDIFDTIIESKVPFGICPHVYQELLQGAKNTQEFDLLKEYLDDIIMYDLHYGKKSYENAALMYLNCRKAGITPRSSIDMIIAQTAIENNLILFHNDKDYGNIAKINTNLRCL